MAKVRPVGEPIRPRPTGRAPESFFEGGRQSVTAFFFNSGTEALAAALQAAMARYSGHQPPEVVIPAYCCPNILAAVRYAGARVVPAELRPRSPWLDPRSLRERLSDATAAVVAVDFLGMREDHEAVKAQLQGREVVLIEDAAQLLWSDSESAVADMVIQSFGRGKPVSALGGGALLVHRRDFSANVPRAGNARRVNRRPGVRARLRWRLKIAAYNWLIGAWAYSQLEKTPGLGVGATEYRPLSALRPASPMQRRAIAAVLAADEMAAYGRPSPAQRVLTRWFREWPDKPFRDLNLDENSQARPLLRYPLWFENQRWRDKACELLNARGIGASPLYRQPVSEFGGVKAERLPGCPNAGRFARGLLTLPVHSGVRQPQLTTIYETLAEMANRPQ